MAMAVCVIYAVCDVCVLLFVMTMIWSSYRLSDGCVWADIYYMSGRKQLL